MDENEKLLDLFDKYKNDLSEMNRDEVYKITSSVESIILRHFNADCAYKKDLDYIRKNLGMMIAFQNDEGAGFIAGQDLKSMKNMFSGLLESLSDEIRAIGIPKKNKEKGNMVNVNITQNQSQNQSFSLFFDSIKDEITGKQLRELKEIIAKEPDLEKAKPKIIEKIKSFGSDICSNIIANIITNPAIWSGLL